VAIFGQGIGPPKLTLGVPSPAGMFGATAGNTRVLFDGTPAPVIYSSALQTAAVVPYVAALKPTAHVQVEYLGSRSDVVELPISQVAPAIFTGDASGRGQAAVINQDGSLNSTAHPAPRGSIISIYCTGEGQSNPPGVDGKISDAILPKPLVPVSVTIGGITVVPAYAGAAGAAIAGALQINVKIPDSIAPGNLVPVAIQIGAAVSQPNVTIAVN
jgi:uncharacterized protein (TIGR03437 family)